MRKATSVDGFLTTYEIPPDSNVIDLEDWRQKKCFKKYEAVAEKAREQIFRFAKKKIIPDFLMVQD